MIAAWRSACPAAAAWDVKLTGTLAEGSLNGTSIDGSSFVMSATVASDDDLSPGEGALGVFSLSQAVMSFGTAGQFVFDADDLFFATQLFPPNPPNVTGSFDVGFVDTIDVSNATQFGFSQFPPSFPSTFDPNVLQRLSVDDFDGSFVGGAPSGPTIQFSNAGSDVLVIGKTDVNPAPLGLFGTLTIIPEPTVFALAVAGMLPGLLFAARTRRISRATWHAKLPSIELDRHVPIREGLPTISAVAVAAK